eukprot:284815012_3
MHPNSDTSTFESKNMNAIHLGRFHRPNACSKQNVPNWGKSLRPRITLHQKFAYRHAPQLVARRYCLANRGRNLGRSEEKRHVRCFCEACQVGRHNASGYGSLGILEVHGSENRKASFVLCMLNALKILSLERNWPLHSQAPCHLVTIPSVAAVQKVQLVRLLPCKSGLRRLLKVGTPNSNDIRRCLWRGSHIHLSRAPVTGTGLNDSLKRLPESEMCTCHNLFHTCHSGCTSRHCHLCLPSRQHRYHPSA